jgi:hypothetical protein
MKKWLLLSLAVLVMWPAPAAGQEEAPAAAQEEAPTWWAVFTEQVRPSMVDQYESVAAEMRALIGANASEDLEYYTLFGPETGYLYAVPMESMAEFTELGASWEAMVDKVGRDTWMEVDARGAEAVENRSLTFYVERADLSYKPETPRLTEDEAVMRHYDWVYPVPGKEMETEAVMKEWVELYATNGVTSGFYVYQAVTGDDLPMYVVSTHAASQADYFADGDQLDEMLGEADDALWMKTRSLLRDFEHNNAWLRPDLSLVQEEE